MKKFIERIKIHLWYDWRIVIARKNLIKASLQYNNNGNEVNEIVYYICKSSLHDLVFHREIYLKELS